MGSGNLDGLDADELGLQPGLSLFEQHRHDLAEIDLELIKGRALGMAPGQPGTYPTKMPVSGSRSMTAVALA